MSFKSCSFPPAARRRQMVRGDGRPSGFPRQLAHAGALPHRQPTSAQSLCCLHFVEVDDAAGVASFDRMAEIVDLQQGVVLASWRWLRGASSRMPRTTPRRRSRAGGPLWYQAACATERFASSASIRACAAPAGASSRRTGCGSSYVASGLVTSDSEDELAYRLRELYEGLVERDRQLQAAGGGRSRRPSSTRTRAPP